MCVDGVKIYVRNALFIKTNPLLWFELVVRSETGEPVYPYEEAKYKNLVFMLYDTGFLKISGSLHKFKNDGLHNYDNFTHSKLCEVLREFQNFFGLDLKKCEIHNIEFGVNITPFIDTAATLDYLLNHKNKMFDSEENGNYRQAKHRQYICKLYNKAYQNNLREPLMRWELKFIKMEKINRLGIYCLNDLLETGWMKPVGKMILAEWHNVLIYDITLQKANLDYKTREVKLNQWNNPMYWKGLNKHKKRRELEKYNICVENFSDKLQFQNSNRIQTKWMELQN